MEDNVQKVEWSDRCPNCKKELTFQIKRVGNRTYRAYILTGCEHFAQGYINQVQYRMICNMLRELYENPDLLYARMKKKEELQRMKMLGIDVSKYI